jgi:predicted  nucleic acid-binding Zn-ribbon protein
MTFLAEMYENTPKKVVCTRCGHLWRTRSRNRLVTCSHCNRKTLNQWGKKQKQKQKPVKKPMKKVKVRPH